MSAAEPWGYLLPLRDGPAPLELRQDAETAVTAPSYKQLAAAAASGLPAGAPPPLLFSLRRDAASGSPVLRSAADAVWVDDQQVPRGRKRTLLHGARIAFQPGVPTYVYVDRKESDNFRAPRDVLDEYLVGHCLGKGGFGNVYALFHKKQNYSKKALKIVELNKEKIHQYAKREARIIMSLDHPCIIETYSVTRLRNDYYLLMEYLTGGDLTQYVNDQRLLTEVQTKLLFFQLALAVEYLHNENICHRDLTPANVLLHQRNPKTLIKVTDFGLAKEKYWDSSLGSYAGTRLYLAPEIAREEKSYTNSVDVWSMGIILFYSLTGTVPFENVYQGLRRKHIVEYIPEHWGGVSEDAEILVRRMLTPQASRRISVTEVLEDPWLQDGTMRKEASLLPGLQNYIESRGSGGEQVPWGYLLPLQEGFLPLELKLSSTMVRTDQISTLHVNAMTPGVSSTPQNLFVVIRSRSGSETVLHCETDCVFVNCKKITQSRKEILQHGAFISFVEKETLYVFVDRRKSDSSHAPRNVLKDHLVVPFFISGSFKNMCILFDKKMKYQRKVMKIVESRREAEIHIIKHLKFPSIIEVFDIFEMNKKHFLIMEYMAGGDLEQFVNDEGPLSEGQAKLIFYQIALAVLYLHEIKVCVGNLQPSNVLLQHQQPYTVIKITTFDAKKDSTIYETVSYERSRQIQEPELLFPATHTMTADVRSMGIILCYILSGTRVFEGGMDIIQRERNQKYDPSELVNVSSTGKHLVERLLNVKMDDRQTASQVIEDPWLKDEVMRDSFLRLTGIQNFVASPSEQMPPWGYLIPLEDCLPSLELRQRSATIGTHDTCTLKVKASLVGLPDYVAAQVVCMIVQSTESALLSIEQDKVYLNGEELQRGDIRVIQNGARITFGAANYVFVNQEDRESFRAPQDLLDKYLVGPSLGAGGFGKVYMLFDKKLGYQRKAMKIVQPKDEMQAQFAEREARILMTLKHPCVIATYSFKRKGQQTFLVMEYLAGGDLSQYVNDECPLSEAQTKLIFFQLALAVQYLHERDISHRDLKPENILLQRRDPYSLIKVTDFGLAKAGIIHSTMKTTVGTMWYVAPEVWQGKLYANSVDLWSMGVILFYSLTGAVPFRSLEEAVLVRHVVKFDPVRWRGVSFQAQLTVKSLLKAKATDRVSAARVLEDPWLQDDKMREDAFQLTGLKEIRPRPSSRPKATATATTSSGKPLQQALKKLFLRRKL